MIFTMQSSARGGETADAVETGMMPRHTHAAEEHTHITISDASASCTRSH